MIRPPDEIRNTLDGFINDIYNKGHIFKASNNIEEVNSHLLTTKKMAEAIPKIVEHEFIDIMDYFLTHDESELPLFIISHREGHIDTRCRLLEPEIFCQWSIINGLGWRCFKMWPRSMSEELIIEVGLFRKGFELLLKEEGKMALCLGDI